MAEVAKKDSNGRSSLIAVSSLNGTTVLALLADPVTHRLKATTTTVGDNGNNQGNAMVDENSVSVMTALSSADGSSIIEVYADPTTKALFLK